MLSNLNLSKKSLVNEKITASCPTNTLPTGKLCIKFYKQQKWTLKNSYANKFLKPTISIRFNPLQVCPSVLYFCIFCVIGFFLECSERLFSSRPFWGLRNTDAIKLSYWAWAASSLPNLYTIAWLLIGQFHIRLYSKQGQFMPWIVNFTGIKVMHK